MISRIVKKIIDININNMNLLIHLPLKIISKLILYNNNNLINKTKIIIKIQNKC